jgi:hypothetical protein
MRSEHEIRAGTGKTKNGRELKDRMKTLKVKNTGSVD